MSVESKLTFRPLSTDTYKYTYSSNTPYGCDGCRIMKQPGQDGFRLCAGCRNAHYCSRACQKADWTSHRIVCKSKQETLALIGSTAHMPRIQDGRMQMLRIEDFARAHTFTFDGAIHALVAHAGPTDFRSNHVVVELEERDGHDGNPATTYEVQNIALRKNPVAPSGDGIMDELFKGVNYCYSEWERMAKENPGVTELLIVVYRSTTGLGWAAQMGLCPSSPSLAIFARNVYLSTTKELTGKGIVFRLIGAVRKPGVLEKKGVNWVWKELTFPQLRAEYGVTALTPEMLQPWLMAWLLSQSQRTT